MKRGILLLLVLALLPGCSSTLPQSNQPPKAYINAINPSEVTQGGVVHFSGHGTDANGQVVAYRWRSNKDGELSVSAEFETSSLSAGEHVISFTVQDNNDAWSAEATGAVRVLAVASISVRIDSFTASHAAIAKGDSVTLAWNVSNATTVSIDQGVGSVSPVGTALVTPGATTTYTLSATGGGSTVVAKITVTVQQSMSGATLTADSEASGYVRSSGAYTTGFVYVGDDSSNRDFQGFVTFDISHIPASATITRVTIDLSTYETPYDSPFAGLGCLSAYAQDYGTLDGRDYWTASVPTPMAVWCDSDDLDAPKDWTGFRSALQKRVGEGSFQFRLQFADAISDGDDANDLLRWPMDRLPRMIVEYYA